MRIFLDTTKRAEIIFDFINFRFRLFAAEILLEFIMWNRENPLSDGKFPSFFVDFESKRPKKGVSKFETQMF